LAKEKAGARLPTFNPPVTTAIFTFDEGGELFLPADGANFFAVVVFLTGIFVFAVGFDVSDAAFFFLLDGMFDGMNSSL
jgi:hypothetical protein